MITVFYQKSINDKTDFIMIFNNINIFEDDDFENASDIRNVMDCRKGFFVAASYIQIH